jgi:hypothetical protein
LPTSCADANMLMLKTAQAVMVLFIFLTCQWTEEGGFQLLFCAQLDGCKWAFFYGRAKM